MSTPATKGAATTKAPRGAAPRGATQTATQKATSVAPGRRSNAGASLVMIRLRGTVRLNTNIADTLEMLRLNRPNHAVVIPRTESYMGMVGKVKDYVAYGDIDAPTMAMLIKSRGRVMGDTPIDDAFVAKATSNKFANIDAFAKAVADGKATMKDLGEDAKPVFRMNPPVGGFKGSTKKHYTVKGELGYRGKEINELIKRMM